MDPLKLNETINSFVWGPVMLVALVVTVVTGLDYVREAVRLRRQALARP